ncbi:RING-type E3 ubiquitin transferase [Caerostris extrusa]|uniref:RING-type E3 ubiquitin transferase n=1 Tax=Caerostris extrusa TaxID=172846 RepID=A0AAV4U4A8_CAEEX|nr:RING-type E3 ubiquitin transferase [Caerostris extrusa]
MCRDLTQRRNCPRGLNCTFAHSQEELEKFRAKSKRNPSSRTSGSSVRSPNPDNSVCVQKDDDSKAGNSESVTISSLTSSSAVRISSECRTSNCFHLVRLIQLLSDNSSGAHLSSDPVNNRCTISISTSHPNTQPSHQTSHVLNPETPAFQPLTQQSCLKFYQCNHLINHYQLQFLVWTVKPWLLFFEKKKILAQLDKAKLSESSCPATVENGIISPSDGETSYYVLKTMDNGNVVSFYSPWTSTNVFPSDSSTYCTNSDYNSSLSMSCSETNEFIPFDPPLVSKYGPISRCSKSLIRGPAPIQVNAVSHMGELTSPTSAVRHPLPSASFAPSFYATNPSGFTVPVAIIPEQYLPVVKSASVVVPVAMDCTVLPT